MDQLSPYDCQYKLIFGHTVVLESTITLVEIHIEPIIRILSITDLLLGLSQTFTFPKSLFYNFTDVRLPKEIYDNITKQSLSILFLKLKRTVSLLYSNSSGNTASLYEYHNNHQRFHSYYDVYTM